MARRKVHPTHGILVLGVEALHVMAKRKVHPTLHRCGTAGPALHVMAKRKVHPTLHQEPIQRLGCMSWQKEGCCDLERLDREGIITPSVGMFYRIIAALGMRVEVIKPIISP